MEVATADIESCGHALASILDNRAALVICRQGLPTVACAGGDDEPFRELVMRNRSDIVPGKSIGATSYLAPTAAYIRNCREQNATMERFISRTGLAQLIESLRRELTKQGLALRRATHEGQSLSAGVVRSWTGQGAYQLSPHDDWAQVSFPDQADLEISKIWPTVVSCNVCLENSYDAPQGGLRVWDFQPSEADRVGHDSLWHGYPYDEESLNGIESRDFEIRKGDLYFINGRHVHAVLDGAGVGERTTFAMTMGRVGSDVIHWA